MPTAFGMPAAFESQAGLSNSSVRASRLGKTQTSSLSQMQKLTDLQTCVAGHSRLDLHRAAPDGARAWTNPCTNVLDPTPVQQTIVRARLRCLWLNNGCSRGQRPIPFQQRSSTQQGSWLVTNQFPVNEVGMRGVACQMHNAMLTSGRPDLARCH